MNKKHLQGIMAGCLLLSCSGAFAAEEWGEGTVQNIFTDTTNYGRCMIMVPEYSSTISCPSQWVSLGCAGDYHSKEDARRMWDVVQMAAALEQPIGFTVVDTEKYNGYCVVKNVGIYN